MLNHEYRNMMRNHPYGYACYQPESSLIVKPGALGYINNDGRWTPLVNKDGANLNLGAPNTLASSKLTTFTGWLAAPLEEMSWGPKISDRANGINLDFQADASLIPAGMPADIGALFTFKTDESSGAILLTKTPVVREAVYYEKAYKSWCKENATAIISNWPDVKDHGLVIVTSIHKTSQADLISWKGKEKEIKVGFKASSIGIGELAPSSEWYTASSDIGWITSKAPDNTFEQKVVFFGGIYWKFNKISEYIQGQGALTSSNFDKLRSDQALDCFTTVYDEWNYRVSCEEIGTRQVGPEPPAEEDEQIPDLEYSNTKNISLYGKCLGFW